MKKKKSTWWTRFKWKVKTKLTRQVWKKEYPSKEDWDRINKIDWNSLRDGAAEVFPPITALSEEGMSYAKCYNSFSGVDVKMYLVKIDGSIECLPEMQSYYVKKKAAGDVLGERVSGTIKFVIFDKSLWNKLNDGTVTGLWFYGANEYGIIGRMDIEGIRFTEWSHGLDINDLAAEECVKFEAFGVQPWKPTDKSPAHYRLEWEKNAGK